MSKFVAKYTSPVAAGESGINKGECFDESSILSANDLNTVVQNIMALRDMIYPIGSVFITSTNQNPSSLFGGVWAKITQVNFIFGFLPNHVLWERKGKRDALSLMKQTVSTFLLVQFLEQFVLLVGYVNLTCFAITKPVFVFWHFFSPSFFSRRLSPSTFKEMKTAKYKAQA